MRENLCRGSTLVLKASFAKSSEATLTQLEAPKFIMIDISSDSCAKLFTGNLKLSIIRVMSTTCLNLMNEVSTGGDGDSKSRMTKRF